MNIREFDLGPFFFVFFADLLDPELLIALGLPSRVIRPDLHTLSMSQSHEKRLNQALLVHSDPEGLAWPLNLTQVVGHVARLLLVGGGRTGALGGENLHDALADLSCGSVGIFESHGLSNRRYTGGGEGGSVDSIEFPIGIEIDTLVGIAVGGRLRSTGLGIDIKGSNADGISTHQKIVVEIAGSGERAVAVVATHFAQESAPIPRRYD